MSTPSNSSYGRARHRYQLSVSGLQGLQLDMRQDIIEVGAGEVRSLPVGVRIDPINLERPSNEIAFTLTAQDDATLTTTQTGRFIGPAAGGH